MNIAIVGLGNIGSYFYNYLKKNRNIIFNKTNVTPIIKFISARSFSKKRTVKIPKSLWLKNYLDATKSKDIDIIVELIGGAEGAAKKLVFAALKNKKHVITANKALVAKYGDQLARIAEKNKEVKEVIKKDNTQQKIVKSSNIEKIKKITKNEEVEDANSICEIITDCDIDKIAELLIKKGREKDFPDITAN